MWRGLWPDLPVHRIPIGHITNGVHVGTWLSMDMARLYGRHLREGWQQRLGDPETWRPVGQIKDEEFWEQHQIMKVHLAATWSAACAPRGSGAGSRWGRRSPPAPAWTPRR